MAARRILDDSFAGASEEATRAELGLNQSGSNQLILTKEEQARRRAQAKKEAAVEAAAAAAEAKARTPQSKAQRKKLEQIAAKKRKGEERASVLASLSAHRVDATQRAMLRTSGTMGQELTKRQRLQRAIQAKAANIVLDGMEDLEMPREEAETVATGVPAAFDSARAVAGVGGAAAEGQEKDDAYWAAQATGFGTAVDYFAGARPRAKSSRATLDAAARGVQRSREEPLARAPAAVARAPAVAAQEEEEKEEVEEEEEEEEDAEEGAMEEEAIEEAAVAEDPMEDDEEEAVPESAAVGERPEEVCMYVHIRRHQHTRVHARTGPRRHARAPACRRLYIPRLVRRQALHCHCVCVSIRRHQHAHART